jgi:hypothetical protein
VALDDDMRVDLNLRTDSRLAAPLEQPTQHLNPTRPEMTSAEMMRGSGRERP